MLQSFGCKELHRQEIPISTHLWGHLLFWANSKASNYYFFFFPVSSLNGLTYFLAYLFLNNLWIQAKIFLLFWLTGRWKAFSQVLYLTLKLVCNILKNVFSPNLILSYPLDAG